MPVIDATRTDLEYQLPSGARALRFDQRLYSVFDLFILKRAGAESDYSAQEIEQAQSTFRQMSIKQP